MPKMDFTPVSWRPPTDMGLVGDYEPNERLTGAALWDTGGIGPEDVAIDHNGRPVTGLEDGRIVRFPDDSGVAELLGTTDGRPLGIETHPADGFVICDADRGLLHMQEDGAVVELATNYRNNRFMVTNNAAIAPDGSIYFSVSSHRRPLSQLTHDILEQSGTGRLYRRDVSGEIEIVLDGLVFANGVALSKDGDFVLVAETGRYRIHRVWLEGERAGRSEIFVDNLPGFPDNLNRWHTVFWCGLVRVRDKALDATLPRPWMRTVLARLPESLLPKPGEQGLVVGFDHEARVVMTLQDQTGRLASTTGAQAEGFRLYVNSLTRPHLAVAQLPTSFDF